MKARYFLVNVSAILFILLFIYKSGGGLFVHNSFHTSNSREAKTPGDKDKEASIACTCIDDFLVPVQDPGFIEYALFPVELSAPHLHFRVFIPFSRACMPSLRGPPSSISVFS